MIAETTSLSLNVVYKVTATPEPDVYDVSCNVTDMDGTPQDTVFCLRPEAIHGLAPIVRAWLEENPDFPVSAYVPPTQEEVRARMTPLTARQFRLGLIEAGLSSAHVATAIEAMPVGPDKEKAKIEWEYATTFNRMHPLIATVGGALGLNDEQIDAMWLAAVSL